MIDSKNATGQASEAKNSTLHLVFAWAWVGIPLAWGVSQTFIKAMGLFN